MLATCSEGEDTALFMIVLPSSLVFPSQQGGWIGFSATCAGSHERVAVFALSEGERCPKFHSTLVMNGTSCGAQQPGGHALLSHRWSREPAIVLIVLQSSLILLSPERWGGLGLPATSMVGMALYADRGATAVHV